MTATPPRRTLLIVPLTQPNPAAMREAVGQAVRAGADAVELRLDYLSQPTEEDLRGLLADRPCPVIVTARSPAEGGHGELSQDARLRLLEAAARLDAEWIDIELATLQAVGSLPPALARVAARKLIVSAHDFVGRPDLPALLARLEGGPGAVNKIAFAASGPEDALAAIDLLRASRKPAIALAMGEHGLASRILAAKFAAFGTFASLTAGSASATGQPSIADLRGLYRWADITPATKVYGVIGCPVGHSMSPAIHNAAFAAAGQDAVYLPLRIEPGAEHFNRFIDAALARPWLGLAGLSVTIPHKENALARVGTDNVDPLAASIGAINTVALTGDPDRPMLGRNTDYAAAIDALVEAMGWAREDLAGRRVAVLGAGGAARALVAALAHYGAHTTIYNRTVLRGETLAAEFDSPVAPVRAAGMDALPTARAEIVINCTPIGMFPHVDACPLPDDFDLAGVAVVFDTIYNPATTELLRRAARAGCRTVTGLEMFVNQAVAQYELWTGRPAPRQAMREVVLRRLSAD